ncbi:MULTISPECIES: phosphoenolpyruvate carboxykinase (GTP) [Microbacterium]|jgi:phosphoenolpyruvate carboxykinase (GTP)|uniref:Phosphoenolpyruvate carboxykinase [GTP] n=1 Tax=Microbacterium maritypicum TaxID=33918 RepID=A0AAD3X5A3_MICMQ|nr:MULTISPECIES: phosphoenolpyruvate carboxykinase (GTP) [Microbacterium]AZS47859.1 Phosphoenolpyruvate carboxykinase [GTP] [Microbacterium oxydans]KAB1886765.1 phosphoenolpyruvate carboxykinase (GTP) [Microbacterium liquefaciens]KQV01830.1 phosphoenolpyruvate carboxykinase [Microbacterium sp. Root322]KQY77282.1 phosphoenolpyruvate carboxykinase [Microbacterium sp. Root1433D1]WKT89369.1 phosphoenolpyruvate carboxykinase (GTP) [Microbacterium liquefaciens]
MAIAEVFTPRTSPVAQTRTFGAAPTYDTPAMAELAAWVEEIRALTQPDAVHWVDGSPAENDWLLRGLVDEGKLIKLNPEWRPGSYLARSHPSDVARTEGRTFISSEREEDAGPTNNWAAPAEMHAKMDEIFEGSMRGRTMYVVPFSMGRVGGPLSHIGVQITDSAYAVASIGIMTRVGDAVTRQIAEGAPWVKTVHSVGAPLAPGEQDAEWPCNDDKYIVHFPETLEVYSYGSGYGGNAILAKKCFALRIASVIARDEGWLAEHMLLIRVIDPQGKAYHVAAAFPSACGKTNLAMLRPTIPGWRVETLGDDIAWIRPGEDGRMWAINPEAGFFGVAPGTGESTNVTAVETLWGNTIFTNVALRPDGDVWWEGLTDEAPAHLIDWEGNDWTPESGRPAAHPNSRFTVSAAQCPQISEDWEEAVPLDVILFGGRRASNVPLVVEATDWTHGVFLGSNISSERTAAAEGTVGELRRDPFAMLPFCGYNMADYFGHWLKVGRGLRFDRAPRIFQVNWFRRGADGRFLWPGFGDNSRVVDWIIRRIAGDVSAVDSPIGRLPRVEDLNLDGLDIPAADLDELFSVDAEAWKTEADLTEAFYDTFGDKVPAALRAELASLRYRLDKA